MLLMMQIAGGTALGLLLALVVVDYFEEIVLTLIISLGLGLPMLWIFSTLEGNTNFLKKLGGILRPLFQI